MWSPTAHQRFSYGPRPQPSTPAFRGQPVATRCLRLTGVSLLCGFAGGSSESEGAESGAMILRIGFASVLLHGHGGGPPAWKSEEQNNPEAWLRWAADPLKPLISTLGWGSWLHAPAHLEAKSGSACFAFVGFLQSELWVFRLAGRLNWAPQCC